LACLYASAVRQIAARGDSIHQLISIVMLFLRWVQVDGEALERPTVARLDVSAEVAVEQSLVVVRQAWQLKRLFERFPIVAEATGNKVQLVGDLGAGE